MLLCLLYFLLAANQNVSHILAGQAEEVQQYVKNGSRAIRGRVFPEYVCIEDVDKIISSVQRAPEETAGRGEPGKHLTASETRFTPIDRLTASAMNGKGPCCSAQHKVRRSPCHTILKRTITHQSLTKSYKTVSSKPNKTVFMRPYLSIGLL